MEILVSITILILLLLVVAQIVSATQNISSASDKSLGADGESRTVFDRMAIDIARMVRRTDVDYLLNRQTGNDSFFFYSEAPAFSAPSATLAQQNSVALVGYRINSNYQLERLGKGLTWAAAPSDGMVFLTYASYPVTAASTPLAASTLSGAYSALAANSTDSNYHVLGPDVFRLEFCFLLNACTDTSGVRQPAIYSNVPYDSRLGHTSTNGIGLTDVQALVVGMAILDSSSRKVIPTTTNWSTVSNLLVDPSNTDLSSAPPKLMATSWQGVMTNGTFVAGAGIPKDAANQVRIYQRVFPLNTR
jgi:type II secretory pathway component PulJ